MEAQANPESSRLMAQFHGSGDEANTTAVCDTVMHDLSTVLRLKTPRNMDII